MNVQQCTDAPILISYLSHLVKVTKLFSRFWVIVFRISCDKVIFLPILFPCMQRIEEVARRAAGNPPVKCRNCVTIIARTSEHGTNGDGLGGTRKPGPKRYRRRRGTENVSDLTSCFLSTRCQHSGSVSKQARKEKAGNISPPEKTHKQ